MAVDTHGRWPLVSAALVAPAWATVLAQREALGRDASWVAMLDLPILVAHQTEEWVRPGLPVTMKRRMRRARRGT